MGMILEYDQSSNATVDQKVSTLKDSVQRALEDVEKNVEGKPGAPGVGIEEIIEQWNLSTSQYSPVGEWVYLDERPEWKPGHYFWTRNEVHYTDGNIRYTTPGLADALNKAYEAAYEADGVLGDIEETVSTIEQTVKDIEQIADETKELAEQAKEDAESAVSQAQQVQDEINTANQQIATLTQELETLESTMTANYATKGELTQVKTDLGTQIEQNAAQISQTATKVQEIEVDATQALQDAADAATAAEQAQQNATDAQNKYTQLKQQADATDEQLAAAEEAVQQAQAAASAAGDAAAAAAAAASALADRVTTAESNITQNAEQISQTVTKVDSLKFGGRNLILESDIMEESGEYGFGERGLSLALKPNTEYTLSANGRVNGCDTEHYLLVKVETEDGSWSAQVQVSGEDDNTQSSTFTTPEWADDTEAKVKCYFAPENTGSSGTCTVNWVKLEEGNKPTDWTPAPEDINVQLSESLEAATSEILQTAESITMRIVSGYTSSDDFEEYKQQVENLFEASENGFEFQFNQLQQNINDVSQEIVERNQFIRLEEGNIIIGKSDSPIQAKFTNDSLEFLYNDQTVAKFTNEVLEVHNVSVENQIRFGSDWAIRPGSTIDGKGNNLNVVWIGG